LILGDSVGLKVWLEDGFADGTIEGTLIGAGIFTFVSGSPWANDSGYIEAFANTPLV
jgi:hypothetical protein